MFIRKKRIKGIEYAYLVRNVWRKRKKSSRQKVSKYLGRIYIFKCIYYNNFIEFYKINELDGYINKTGRKSIIKDLIRLELINMGFKENNSILVNDGLQFNIETLTFSEKERAIKAVIEMNEGFLCKETINSILNFKQGDEEREGYNLANAFVEAGLKVPEDVFVEYYKRFFGLK